METKPVSETLRFMKTKPIVQEIIINCHISFSKYLEIVPVVSACNQIREFTSSSRGISK
jgi:hypothetical protein